MLAVTPSSTYLLIESRLRERLDKFLLDRRADERSWDYIAREIRSRTDVTVSRETLRLWHNEIIAEHAA